MPVAKRLKMKRKCLVPECFQLFFSRGLCKGHYIYAARLVRKGEYSWAKLEKKGKVLPPGRNLGRASTLRIWFESK